MDVYMDSAATSREKPECVYEAMDRFMREVGVIPGRSAHGPGIEASRTVAAAREKVAALFGISDSSRLVFTASCTEALNLAINGVLKSGENVVTTSMEHNSVMRPLRALEGDRKIRITQVPASNTGETEPNSVVRCLGKDTALVVMTHASNVTGTIQPVRECCDIARERGIPVLVDAAQTAGCLPIDVDDLGVDMLAFSGHKGLLGPQGVGCLYVREGIDLVPLKYGGTGSRSADEVQPDFMPDMYESGTPNTPGIAGLGAAATFLAGERIAAIRGRILAKGDRALAGLRGISGVTVHGAEDMHSNVGVFSITVDGHDSGELAEELESRYGLLTRVGLQCAPCAHRTIGTFPEGTIRASVGYSTTDEEVELFITAIAEIAGGPREGAGHGV